MTEGQVQRNWALARNNGKFEITEFQLAGSNCNSMMLENTHLIFAY